MGTEHTIETPLDIQLIDDRIMVRYIEPESVTASGIHLPQQTVEDKKEQVQASVVVNVGPGRFTSHGEHEAMMDIEIGDIVFHAQFLGWLLKIPNPETGEDEEYRIFGQHDIFGYRKNEEV